MYISIFVERGPHSREPELFWNIAIVWYMALSKINGYPYLGKSTKHNKSNTTFLHEIVINFSQFYLSETRNSEFKNWRIRHVLILRLYKILFVALTASFERVIRWRFY